jgi:cell division septation protein DedD
MSVARPAVHGAVYAQGTDTLHKSARADSAATHDTAQATATPAVSAGDSTRPQRTTAAPRDTAVVATGADTVLQRVRSLVAQGQTAVARALVDSLLTVTPTTSPSYASVLYTRGTLETNADSAENDYRRLIIEYAASPRVADALLRLAQLELARGDRTQAAAHLDRLIREQLPNQTGATFARTELQVGLAYFDLQDAAHACSALAAARTAAPASDVELRNRIDYNVGRCPPPETAANNPAQPRDTTRGARGAGATGRPAAGAASDTMSGHGAKTGAKSGASSKARSTPAAPTTPKKGTSDQGTAHSAYSVQVAAYPTHAAAVALVDRLAKRGYVAHIFGTAAPFRVRVGRFATEAQADSAVQSLRRKGMPGFVTPDAR